jgi:hypothetical protein
MQLKMQQAEIIKLEKHISTLSRQLEANYDINKILSKEDELKLLQAEFAALVEEKEAVLGSTKKTIKATEFLKVEQEYNQKVNIFIFKSYSLQNNKTNSKSRSSCTKTSRMTSNSTRRKSRASTPPSDPKKNESGILKQRSRKP